MKRSDMLTQVRRTALVVLTGGALVSMAACSGGGSPSSTRSDDDQPGGKATTAQFTFAMVTHGPPGDTFWDQVQRGAEAAAAKDKRRPSNAPCASWTRSSGCTCPRRR